MAHTKSQKLTLKHPSDPGVSLAGILEQIEPSAPTRGRPIALILHGTMGHKDYLFQKALAARLPLDSFRFDFRGAHESGGTFSQGGFADDVEDVRVVVAYLTQEYGYKIDLLVGHSRGSVVAMRWLCTSDEGKYVSGFVNVSARYKMDVRGIQDLKEYQFLTLWLNEHGYSDWKVTVAGRTIVTRITAEDLRAFASWDTSIVWKCFPSATNVLTVHGMGDKVVPPYDATIYARALGARIPGTHNLYFVEFADHNFTQVRGEVVDAILQWWEKRKHGELKTGLWQTGVPHKL
ncbi:Alpha/Beta hydrolase protein [Lactarius sanguifluus]|nr:Alpha/Beta hydrolase protein [Lactarius sanguifluus]